MPKCAAKKGPCPHPQADLEDPLWRAGTVILISWLLGLAMRREQRCDLGPSRIFWGRPSSHLIATLLEPQVLQ